MDLNASINILLIQSNGDFHDTCQSAALTRSRFCKMLKIQDNVL